MKKTILLLGVVAAMLCSIPAVASDHMVRDMTTIEDMVGDKPLKFSGGIRQRGEVTDNMSDFDSDGTTAGQDDFFAFAPYRVRFGMIGALPKDVYAFIEIQNAGAWGLDQQQRDVLFSNDDDIDLYQAFIKMNDIGGTNNDLYIGRQELVIGTEFLLGDLDFYNGISHDGFRYRYGEENWLDFFWMKASETFALDNDVDLFGLNYAWNNIIEGGDIQVYGYWLRDKGTLTGIDPNARLDLFTIGARVGKLHTDDGGFIYNAELALQTGNAGRILPPAVPNTQPDDASILAYGFEGMFGYEFGGAHQVFVKAYYTSGDDDASDDELSEFNVLFQDFHYRNGIADVVAGTNLTSYSLGYFYDGERNNFGAEYLMFMMSAATTTITSPPGVVTPGSFTSVGHNIASVPGRFDGITVGPNGQDEADLGSELDLWYGFDYSQNMAIEVGLGLFMPGQAIENATDPDGVNGPLAGFSDMAMRGYLQFVLDW